MILRVSGERPLSEGGIWLKARNSYCYVFWLLTRDFGTRPSKQGEVLRDGGFWFVEGVGREGVRENVTITRSLHFG